DTKLPAQRLTYLKNFLIELRGHTAALGDVEVIDYATDSFGDAGHDLDDCAITSVLRAQVPAPPLAQRARVSELLVAAYRAAIDAEHGEGARDASGVASATGRLDTIAHELERIHPPAAALPVLLRARLLGRYSWDVASRLPDARAAIEDARTRIAATRDDIMLARIDMAAVLFELDV